MAGRGESEPRNESPPRATLAYGVAAGAFLAIILPVFLTNGTSGAVLALRIAGVALAVVVPVALVRIIGGAGALRAKFTSRDIAPLAALCGGAVAGASLDLAGHGRAGSSLILVSFLLAGPLLLRRS